MSTEIPPSWMQNLDDEDMTFVKRFMLASGSMKEVAGQYGVSYPTVRLRLDRLIQKIRFSDQQESDPYISLIKRFAVDNQLDLDIAKTLIAEYRKLHDAQQPVPITPIPQPFQKDRSEENVS